ncbi:MAG: sulfite exporter TauE/SafE family protein [Rhizobiales bacterium]|nr:sulfite exporter TauE/SafE family protein [Hyphomicrobiales bacterium]
MQDFLSVLSGGFVGFVLGLVGGGGSIIAVPLLLYLVGIPAAHTAIGTSAVAVSLSAFANLINQARSGLVKWPCAAAFAASGVFGTIIGSYAALQLPGARLVALFGALMIGVGVLMLLRKDAEGDPNVRLTLKTAKSMLPWLIPAGLMVGTLSGFFGIGGGFLIVPALIFATGMPIRNAIATSLVAIVVFGAATAANYAYAGEVDWNLAGFFVGGGIAGGIAGTFAGKALSGHKAALQLVFALFVIATGVYVIYKAVASA